MGWRRMGKKRRLLGMGKPMNSTMTLSLMNMALSALWAASLRPGGLVLRSWCAVCHSEALRSVRGDSTDVWMNEDRCFVGRVKSY